MPNNGIVFECEYYEISARSVLTSTGSGAGTLAYGHSAEAQTKYAPNIAILSDGVFVKAESAFDGTSGTWQVTYVGPGSPFGGYIVGAASFRSDVWIEARLKNLKIYDKITGSLWRIVCDQVDIYVNGAFDVTLPGSSFDLTSSGVGPNYIPLIGVPADCAAGCSASRVSVPLRPAYNCLDPGAGLPIEWTAQAESTATVGTRFMQDGVWYTLAATPKVVDLPSSVGCPYSLDLTGILDVDSTLAVLYSRVYAHEKTAYESRVYGEYHIFDCGGGGGMPASNNCLDCAGNPTEPYKDYYYTITDGDEKSCSRILLTADLEQKPILLTDDYASEIFRFEMCESQGQAGRHCENGAVTIDTNNTIVVHPNASSFDGVARDASHAVWDQLDYHCYSPCSISKLQRYDKVWDFESINPGLCSCPIGCTCEIIWPAEPSGEHKFETVSSTFPSYVGNASNDQYHDDDTARYLANRCNPWWQYAKARNDWSTWPWKEYWGPVRDDWHGSVFLPITERTSRRSSMVSAILENESGHTPWIEAYRAGYYWFGVSRFQLDEPVTPSSVQLSTSIPGEWGVRNQSGTDDCTITFNATGPLLSAFAVPVAEVWLESASWSELPFLIANLAKQIAVDWLVANVGSIGVYTEGYDGSRKLLGTVAGTYSILAGDQSKFAGSWAIDNSLGYVDDLGTDIGADGVSSAIMSSPRFVEGFELLKGRQCRRIVFVVTPIDTALTVQLKWPKWFIHNERPDADWWESGKCASLLFKDGPGIRWGQWVFVQGGSFSYPPGVAALGTPNSIIDWLCFRRSALEGIAPDSGLTTELATRYDSYEGQSIVVVDKFSHAFVLPVSTDNKLRAALCNSFSEVPPLPNFPYRKRSEVDWSATGDFWAGVYDYSVEGRPIVSASSQPARLTDSSDVDQGSFVATVSGWAAWVSKPVVDNFETSNWHIWAGGSKRANVAPYHGYFCLFGSSSTKSSPTNTHDRFNPYYRAHVEDGNIFVSRFEGYRPGTPTVSQVTSIGADSDPCLSMSPDKSLSLVFTRGGMTMEMVSHDSGATFEMLEPPF